MAACIIRMERHIFRGAVVFTGLGQLGLRDGEYLVNTEAFQKSCFTTSSIVTYPMDRFSTYCDMAMMFVSSTVLCTIVYVNSRKFPMVM